MRRLLALPDVRVYLAGQALSILGDSALWLAAGIWVKTLTGSNAMAGLTFFFFVAPTLASPLAGLVVDRVRRRPLLVATNLVTGAFVLLLLLVHGRGQVWLIWAVMAGYGLSYTVLGSAQSALLTVIVPGDLLGDANGALRTVREGLRLFAPLLGAGLFAAVGGGAVALLDAATFAAAAVSLLVLRVREPRPAERAKGHWAREVGAGFRHIGSVAVLRQVTISCGAVLLVVGFAETIAFAVVAQGLHRPPSFLGVVVAVQGLGAVIGGPTAAPAMRRVAEGPLAACGMLALAAGGALWAAGSVEVVCLGSVLIGFGLPWLVVGSYTLVQRRTPADLQGRAYSAFDVAVSTPQTISIALGAALIAVIPYQALLALVSVVTALAGGWLITRRAQRPLHPAGAPGARGGEPARQRRVFPSLPVKGRRPVPFRLLYWRSANGVAPRGEKVARDTRVVMTCDLEEEGETAEAVKTVSFAIGGQGYELEMCEGHLNGFDEAMEPYVAASRRVRGTGRGRRAAAGGSVNPPVASRRRRTAASRRDTTDIRAWAQAQGYEVADRGRIPKRVLDAYANR